MLVRDVRSQCWQGVSIFSSGEICWLSVLLMDDGSEFGLRMPFLSSGKECLFLIGMILILSAGARCWLSVLSSGNGCLVSLLVRTTRS